MARFVKFDGQAGSYASTDDVNILSADDAHLVQSQPWGGFRATVADDGIQADGWGQLTATMADVSAAPRINTPAVAIPVAAATTYTYLASVTNNQAYDLDVFWQIIDDVSFTTGGVVTVAAGSTVVVASELTTNVGATVVTSLRLNFANTGGLQIGDTFACSKFLMAVGSVATFVPSLRIVGDLDIRARLAATDWTPTGAIAFLNHRDGANGWNAGLSAAGDNTMWRSDAGGNKVYASSATVKPADGTVHDWRVTHILATDTAQVYLDAVPNGSSTVAFGTPVPATNQELLVGARNFGATDMFDGDMYWGEVRDGIDGPIVAQFNAEDIAIP